MRGGEEGEGRRREKEKWEKKKNEEERMPRAHHVHCMITFPLTVVHYNP